MTAELKPIAGDLPEELDEEIWLNLPYEDARTFCQTAWGSFLSRELEPARKICNRAGPWLRRAEKYLGINVNEFWNRSEIEAALPLRGGNPGEVAQMRYVELVSREGLISDSSYFLSKAEQVRRAILTGNQNTINKKLGLLRFYTPRKQNYIVYRALEDLLSTNLDRKDNYFYRLISSLADRFPGEMSFQPMIKGFFNEPYHSDDSRRYGLYLFWLTAGGYYDTVRRLIGDYQDDRQRKHLLASYIAGSIIRGDRDIIEELTPDIAMYGGYIDDEYEMGAIPKAIGRTTNPEMMAYYLNFIETRSTDFTGIYEIFTEALKKGRLDLADYFVDQLHNYPRIQANIMRGFDNENVINVYSRYGMIRGTDFNYHIYTGSYALQVLEWLISRGLDPYVLVTEDEIQDEFEILDYAHISVKTYFLQLRQKAIDRGEFHPEVEDNGEGEEEE